MPWTKKDADRFKKGLTEAQKKQWVAIANSTLKECLKNNGKECEAKAIKKANGGIDMDNNMKDYKIVANTQVDYDTRVETYNNQEYLVIPVVMMQEGVHSGSGGALLHTASELGKFTAAWNGIPIVVNHPQEDGQYISANAPHVLDKEKVGRVFNVHMDEMKLKGEAWIEPNKLSYISAEALAAIKNKQPLDVSVGVFNDMEETTGEYNGKQYTAVARNHRPDHLALLPGAEGACSWNDGCGIRNNSKIKGGTNMEDEKKSIKNKVDKLVANEATQYTEDDKSWLLEMSEDKLDKLVPVVNTKPEPKEGLTKEDAINALQEHLKNPEEFLNLLPSDMKEQMQSGLNLHKRHKKTLVDTIINNTAEGTWEKDSLAGMDVEVLERIAKSVKPKCNHETGNYAALGNPPATPTVNEQPDAFMPPAGIQIEENK